MMKNNITEIVFILDRSGSMQGLELDTIGGYNTMIEKQKKEDGKAIITTVLFDDEYELLHDRFDINDIKPLTESEYYVRGCTALLDAVGKSITKIANVQKNISQKADKVLFIITTDGYENASKEYTYDKIKSMINEQKEKYGWEFIFMGANIDAIKEAGKFGIDKNNAVNYHSDRVGTNLCYETMGAIISQVRHNKKLSSTWKDSIDKDYNSRNKSKR